MLIAGTATAYDGEVYVTCHLDPNGDNWLALKAAPDIGAQRLARLGPGTFLLTHEPEAVGVWREVSVIDTPDAFWPDAGPSGWVHTDYICYVDMTMR
tara:strand:+ start:8792 stop:9082 length:291 start_codon:yes stop_codon:yes gene_type:complete